ncbi:DUF3108 domain-containing protein [Frigidibacter mobilis]|uniref:DUF3108 domain-containing protein n=1 Tax=Frigidibacter mobilis TaxID=1335048 RepID=A0A159Z1R2_9RHOB|nr:DUF3108 domain-containing protein [Frigidibacter mobilis]AMY67998.1 hypothetical protein AKL17_0739 [Frigidibacter mobilis]
MAPFYRLHRLMTTRPVLAALALALAVPLAPLPAAANQKDSAIFDLHLRGLRAGTLAVSGAINGSSYAASGKLQSTGILAAIKRISYDAKVSGSVSGARFTPRSYHEKADTGRRQSESVMDYRAGVPQLKVYNPPRKPEDQDIDPATQGGTVDPMTAAYAALRDVPEAEACKLNLTLFDGKRRSQVQLSNPVRQGDRITCTGEYRRLEGFSDRDMAEKTRFPFRLIYHPAQNGVLRVGEVQMDTLYGKGVLKRR